MSYRIETLINCDACHKTYCSGQLSFMTLSHQRKKSFRANGWVHKYGKDFCDTCVKEKSNPNLTGDGE